MGFVKYCAYNGMIKEKLFKTGKVSSFIYKEALNVIDLYVNKVYNKYMKKIWALIIILITSFINHTSNFKTDSCLSHINPL